MGSSQQGPAGAACQVCGKTWPVDQFICPDDGTWLQEQTIMEIKRARAPSMPGDSLGDLIDKPPLPPTIARPARVSHTGLGADILRDAAKATPTEIEAGTQIGEYEVEAKIGEGAMGAVYRAVHTAIGKRVAIKVMTPKLFDEPESIKRFVAEARAVAAIEHPSIVDVFGFGRIPDGRTYLVMEWLEGTSLGARMRQGKLDFEEACQIIRQIARALEAAHAKGIVHRDLKPENVFLHMIDEDKPVVKLLDFGLAKTTKPEDGLVAKTRTGQLLGTPLYMSPEQCKAKGVDHRTDIYALGCMAYEMLVGRTPFDADNVAELISAHVLVEPPRPSQFDPHIAPDLDKLMFAMIAKDPDKRPGLGEIRRIFGLQLGSISQPIRGIPVEDPTPPPAATPGPPAAPAAPPPSPGDTVPGSINALERLDTRPIDKLERPPEVQLGVSRRLYVISAVTIALIAVALLVALR